MADDLTDDLSAEAITELVLRREGNDPVMGPKEMRQEITRAVRDWLFDSRGKGVRSGLPL
jgi:hypothetical protein